MQSIKGRRFKEIWRRENW